MPNQATSAQDCAAGIVPAAAWRIKAISILPDYRIAVTFQDNRSGIVDFSAVTKAKDAGAFSQIADPGYFEQVRLELGVVTWPNGADIDPARMHDMLRDNKSWSVSF